MNTRPQILYLVHDLNDAAVKKRVAMLKDGGADVIIAGFHRNKTPLDNAQASPVINLGRTYNGGFVQRIWSVMREVALLHRHKNLFTTADFVIARNLEMLALAVRGVHLCKKPPTLIYECLDIHRLLLNEGAAGKILRNIEGRLAKHASALITSSPAFITNYFEVRAHVKLPSRLIENKVYNPNHQEFTLKTRSIDTPWRIGWFGAIRCAKSLKLLTDLATAFDGKVEIIIRGCPAYDVLPNFDNIVANTPHLEFAGAYINPDDLQNIYEDIHCTWAIDMFEEGLNSSWLLPNRIYEGGLYGAVPIARTDVETGQFLQNLNAGVTLGSPLENSLGEFFKNLTSEKYQGLAKKSASISRDTWLATQDDAKDLVCWLKNLGRAA